MIDSKSVFNFVFAIILLVLCACAGKEPLREPSPDATSRANPTNLQRHIMVFPFVNRTSTDLGRLEVDFVKYLEAAIFKSGRFVLMDPDRARGDISLKNLTPIIQGQVNPLIAQKFWYHLGVQVFVFGEILSFDHDENPPTRTLKVNLALVSAWSGSVTWKKNFKATDVLKSDDLLPLLQQLIDASKGELFEAMESIPWTTHAIKIEEGGNIYIQGGKRSGLQIGDTLFVHKRPPGSLILESQKPLKSFPQKGTLKVTGFVGIDQAICLPQKEMKVDPDDLLYRTD